MSSGKSTNVLVNAIGQNDRSSIKRSVIIDVPSHPHVKRVSLWKPGTLFKIANGKMKCARDRAGCRRSLEALFEAEPQDAR